MCINEKNKVSNVNSPWGVHANYTPLVKAILANDLEAVKEFVRPHSIKPGQNFDSERTNLFN